MKRILRTGLRSWRRDWRSLRRGCWTIQRRRKIPLKILTRRNQILRMNQKRKKKMKRKRRRQALG